MNIQRKRRAYDATPLPKVGTEYDIERVSLKVARNGSHGRWEAHSHSRTLLTRLNDIGLKKLDLLFMKIGSEFVKTRYVKAVSIYLNGCHGLKYFRRGKIVCSTQADLASLLSRIGLPKEYVTRLKKPTNQVSDRLGNANGA